MNTHTDEAQGHKNRAVANRTTSSPNGFSVAAAAVAAKRSVAPQNAVAQRVKVVIGDAARLPNDMGPFEKDAKTLHIFAHSSGEDLHTIDQVGEMDDAAFADYLARTGKVYREGVGFLKDFYTKVYIHACNSTAFAGRVKAALVQLDERNEIVKVYGTKGISATHPKGIELWVIPMPETNNWLKFEKKLAENKGREAEIREWRGKVSIYPNGYDAY